MASPTTAQAMNSTPRNVNNVYLYLHGGVGTLYFYYGLEYDAEAIEENIGEIKIFGLLKNDFSFRRFKTTGKQNIRIELFFLALGFNLKKRWMKQQKSRLETHYSEKKAS